MIAAVERAVFVQEAPRGRVLDGADRLPILERQVVVSVRRLRNLVREFAEAEEIGDTRKIGVGDTIDQLEQPLLCGQRRAIGIRSSTALV